MQTATSEPPLRRFYKTTINGSSVLEAKSLQDAVVEALGPFPCFLSEEGVKDSDLFIDGAMCHPLDSKGKIAGGVLDPFGVQINLGSLGEIPYRSEMLGIQQGTDKQAMIGLVRDLSAAEVKDPGLVAIYLWHTHLSCPAEIRELVTPMIEAGASTSTPLRHIRNAIQCQLRPAVPEADSTIFERTHPAIWAGIVSYLEAYWISIDTGEMVSFMAVLELATIEPHLQALDQEDRKLVDRMIRLLLAHSDGFLSARRELNLARHDLKYNEITLERTQRYCHDLEERLYEAEQGKERMRKQIQQGKMDKVQTILDSDWLSDSDKIIKIRETMNPKGKAESTVPSLLTHLL